MHGEIGLPIIPLNLWGWTEGAIFYKISTPDRRHWILKYGNNVERFAGRGGFAQYRQDWKNHLDNCQWYLETKENGGGGFALMGQWETRGDFLAEFYEQS